MRRYPPLQSWAVDGRRLQWEGRVECLWNRRGWLWLYSPLREVDQSWVSFGDHGDAPHLLILLRGVLAPGLLSFVNRYEHGKPLNGAYDERYDYVFDSRHGIWDNSLYSHTGRGLCIRS